jgi:NAD(P)-dependent dehydrogenase (short-subunit alcohol dehydrogenase family)
MHSPVAHEEKRNMLPQPTLILTGGSAGIGLSILQALADDAFVVTVARTEPPVTNFKGTWIRGDLEDPESVCTSLLEYLRATSRELDGVIFCAASYGASRRHPFLETSDREWDELMAVNVRSQFIMTTRLLPLLLERKQAFIVAISSNTATSPAPGRIAYGCSKAASYTLFSGLAEELRDSNVSVIQMTPDRQVVTRGLRRRRPHGFDFSPYIQPQAFQEPIRAIVRSWGAGMNGQCLTLS